MLDKRPMPLTVKQLVKKNETGSLTFDNSIQRGHVWKKDRQILLISSLIEGYPVPPLFSAETDGVINGKKTTIYDCFDGKQRNEAFRAYLNNEFILEGLDETELENGDFFDPNGLYFKDLPEELKDRIYNYSITMYSFKNITQDEVVEMFCRLNNGKPVSAIELTRAKARSFDTIKELGNHPIFTDNLTAAALNKFTNEDIVTKSWAMVYEERPSLETKDMRPLIVEKEITDVQKKELEAIFDRILAVSKLIKNPKITKRVLARTHLVTMAPFIKKSIDEKVDLNLIASWIEYFFSGKKRASQSEQYNEYSSRNSAQARSIEIRREEVRKSYEEYIIKGSKIPEITLSMPRTSAPKEPELERRVVTSEDFPSETDTGEDDNPTETESQKEGEKSVSQSEEDKQTHSEEESEVTTNENSEPEETINEGDEVSDQSVTQHEEGEVTDHGAEPLETTDPDDIVNKAGTEDLVETLSQKAVEIFDDSEESEIEREPVIESP